MNQSVTKIHEVANKYDSIRVKKDTKKRALSFLKEIKNSDEIGKITFDDLIQHFLKNASEEDIKCLQQGSITWAIEGKRIRTIYEKEYGVLSENLWHQFIQTDAYRDFAKEHSRLPLPWEQSSEMFKTKKKRKSLTKSNNNVTLTGKTA